MAKKFVRAIYLGDRAPAIFHTVTLKCGVVLTVVKTAQGWAAIKDTENSALYPTALRAVSAACANI